MATRQLQRIISLNISKRYMKEKKAHAGNVSTKQLQRMVSLNTKEQYIKERSIHAGTRQLQMVIPLNMIHKGKQFSCWEYDCQAN
jgi:hypothetical protein